MKSNIQSMIIPIGLIAIASLIYTVGTAIMFTSSSLNLQLSYLIAIAVLMPIGFIVIPHFISQKGDLYSKEYTIPFNWKSYFVVAGLIFVINHYFLGSEEYLHQMIISSCEEFLFRFTIYKILRKNYSYIVSILIASLLFGIVLHLNYPILDNLLLRAPMGILFSVLATKFGLEYAIGGHWIYNLWQSII